MKKIYGKSSLSNLRNIVVGLVLFSMLIVSAPNNGLAYNYSENPWDDVLVNSTKVVPPGYYKDFYLSVYYDGSVYNRSYLKFDLTSIPDWATISEAKLSLYNYSLIELPIVDLNYVSDDGWDEGSLLWSNRPAFGVKLDSSTPGNTWQTFDLLNGNNWNYSSDLSDNYLSLIIKEGELSSSTKRALYRQEENDVFSPYFDASYRPHLDITYATPEPATMLLLGLGLVGLAGVRRKFRT